MEPNEKVVTETSNPLPMPTKTKIPYRQIRALYDEETITVYQAYNAAIADAAVAEQKLNASPLFTSRMTWIKPSWTWVNYRAGYSYKDKNQERILALKMSHEGFLELLKRAELTHGAPRKSNDRNEERQRKTTVKVQWDPERSPKLGRLDHRSIQIGIPAGLVDRWISEWIVGIEDVTAAARELKKTVEADKNIRLDELISKGLVPNERVYEVSGDLRDILQMDFDGNGDSKAELK